MARDTFYHYVVLLVDIFAFRHNTAHQSSLLLLTFLMTLLSPHAHKHTDILPRILTLCWIVERQTTK